ncbi:MAG TPA: leucyl aminopeptidase, partial [Candidatus Megaira endosymbiont of Hartmannula sinica]|nr:leucyl aminopeptidase [Candidatus Megaera endosymbiont of Hartmannula sinica]
GDIAKVTENTMINIGGKIFSLAKSFKTIENSKICIYPENMDVTPNINISNINNLEVPSLLAHGFRMSSYEFNKYKTKQKKPIDNKVDKNANIFVDMITSDKSVSENHFTKTDHLCDGVFFARDLVSEVPNKLYPYSYAQEIQNKMQDLDVKISILTEQEMQEKNMNALLGVGQGSAKESYAVVMEYYGSEDREEKPVCFVGKGVTFDTGGISLKPSNRMHEMKYDMAGSAAVVGAFYSIAKAKKNVNVVAIVGLAENMPGANAQRPGDVVTTMSGQTVEVLNTDAEGRLVLCDCLTYLQQNFNPKYIIDLATLTGAIIVSLANSYGGCFSNDDDLASMLDRAGKETGERLWRMPLDKDFDKMIDSDVADIANIGKEGGAAGSSTAAHFLQRFIDKDNKWAHLDIAGMAWDKKGSFICPRGASGYGVRLLNRMIDNLIF